MRPARQGHPNQAGAAIAAAVLTLAVSACGSVTAGQAASRAATARPTPPARPVQCQAAALRVTLAAGQAGAAAGSTFLPLDFTNASGARCWLAGYPAVAFASAGGRPIGPAARPDAAVRGRSVLLAPGTQAHAWLQVAAAGNYPAAACRPLTAPGLRVSIGHGAPRFVAHPLPACAAAGAGPLLTIEPVQPGAARRGTAG